MGRPLSVMAHLKKLRPKKFLAHALIIAISRVDSDSNYTWYRDGWKIRPVVRYLHETTCIDLSNGAGNPELARFQEHSREYKIVVYQGSSGDNIMFEGHVESSKRLTLFYDDIDTHYHVTTNLTVDMAKKYVCKACNKSCRSDESHICDQTCGECNIHFRSGALMIRENHECNKRFCQICNVYKGHMCYMRPLNESFASRR